MCIFCKIITGEIPGYKIYEDENTLAFLDINPVHPGHTLIIPKKHYANLEEITSDELCDLIKAVKIIGKGIKNGLQAEGYNIQVNNDPVAGQIIPHLHFHIIPRVQGDGLHLWPQGQYKEGEAGDIARKIKEVIK